MQPAVSAVSSAKPVIICVDDVREVVDALEEQLSARLGGGFLIEKALTANEALEIIKDTVNAGKEVAVIIADYFMPGMKGDEFLIASHREVPEALKIMLTGQAETHAVTNVINKGALYRFIEKPWDITDMQMSVEEAAKSYVQGRRIDEQNRVLRLMHDAAQIIARQRELNDLNRAMLGVMREYSAADRLVLISQHGDVLRVEASLKAGGFIETTALTLEEAAATLPITLIREAAIAGQLWTNSDTTRALPPDPYFAPRPPASFLILPLINSGKQVGVLYLEHATLRGLFTEERIDILQTLASQAAIAYDHAYLLDHLEETVYERTKELIAANSHKDEMVRIVSHDIRSPLTGIASLAGLLKDQDIAENTPDVMRYGEMIQKSTSNVLKLVNDILDLARLESGKIILSRQEVDLGHFLRGLISAQEPVAFTKQIQLVVNAPSGIMAMVDEGKLAQAVNNLLSNAIKFTPVAGTVTLTLSADAQQARITVSDTGIGIQPDQLPRLFEKFAARQRAGTAGERGTGLGLSIVKELVQMHNGTVGVTSEVGKGTTFTILLPLHA